MENLEYTKRLIELRKEIKKLDDEFIKSMTTLRKGDVVKFIEKGDYYEGEEDKHHKAEIISFNIFNENHITVTCKGIHYEPLLKNVILTT